MVYTGLDEFCASPSAATGRALSAAVGQDCGGMRDKLADAVRQACQARFGLDIEPALTRTDEQFGDWATNVALRLAGQIGEKPLGVAEGLSEHLRQKANKLVQEVTVAAPGFINFRLTDAALFDEANQATRRRLDHYARQTIVIETNNPNPFKDLHIGHAYNAIVADTIANLLAAGGAEVRRVSYHGDVGLHVGMSLWAILRQIDNDPARLDTVPADERPAFLARAYAEGAAAYQSDTSAKQQIEAHARQSFALDEPVFRQVYETGKNWSFAYFDRTFAALGNRPTVRRYLEREADAAGRQIVEANIGAVFKKSRGAIVFPAERYGLHTRVFINSRGDTLYEARDLGLMQLKENDFRPHASYIVTANEQKEYFQVVLKAAELTLPKLSGATKHITHGAVKLTTGKMSSRTGEAVNIDWLNDELTRAVKARAKSPKTVSAAVVGALRYQMLKYRVGGDLIFNTEEAVSLEGNSGPYLQYAHARARSILKKKSEIRNLKSETRSLKLETNLNLAAGERAMVRKIGQYGDALERAVVELRPHHITTCLYELAQAFNHFYEQNRVLGDPRQALRLAIVRAYADALEHGLGLLGIPAPERL